MGIRLKVKTERVALLNAFGRLKTALSDLRPALQSAADELTRRVYYRFQTKRDPDGKRWKPWAPSTAKKRRKEPKARLMLRTRALRDGTRFVAGKKAIFTYMAAGYGVYHEQANPERRTGKGFLPRRAFLFSAKLGENGRRQLAEKDEEMVLNKLRYQVRKALK